MNSSRLSRTRATVVQVTNLGLTVKDSPQNTLVFVTRLDNALPVEGAKVSVVLTDAPRSQGYGYGYGRRA